MASDPDSADGGNRLRLRWQFRSLGKGCGQPASSLRNRTRAITEDQDQSLARPQRRLLRRIFNGRTVPIVADGRAFLTYQEASRYLLTLTGEARDRAYAEMKSGGADR